MARPLKPAARARAATCALVALECVVGEGASTADVANVLCVSNDTARAWLRLAEDEHMVISASRHTDAGLQSLRWYSYNSNTYHIANQRHGLNLQPVTITERID